MINLRAGAALGLRVPLGYAQKWHQGAAVIDFGIAVSADRRAYLFVPLQFQGNDERMMWTIAAGFQYDAATPTPGFFLTPRISIGMTQWHELPTGSLCFDCYVDDAVLVLGNVTPEFGFKYVFRSGVSLGADILSLPVFFNTEIVRASYRLTGYVGAHF